MKCNYKNIQCPYLDTGGNCKSCKYYDNGIRETGAMPNLQDFIDMIKKIWNELIKIN
jgi:hypothetical protein